MHCTLMTCSLYGTVGFRSSRGRCACADARSLLLQVSSTGACHKKGNCPCTVILHVPSVYVGIFTKDVCIMMKYLGNITDDIDSFHLYL